MHPTLTSALNHHAPLGRWYANPLSSNAAHELLHSCETRQQQRRRHGAGDSVLIELTALIARYRLGEDGREAFEHLQGKFERRHSARARALLHLVYGQLLASRQQAGASAHLDEGFRLATPLLHPEDYFSLLNRHRLLALLPKQPLDVALPLEGLITSAAVKERLESLEPKRGKYSRNPSDLYG